MKLMNSFEFKKWFSYFLLILSGIVSYVAINNFAVVSEWFAQLFIYLSPFLAGAVTAYLLDIPCSRIENFFKKIKNKFISSKARGLSVLITYALFILLLYILLRSILPEIVKNIKEFVANFPIYYDNTMIFLLDLIQNDSFINRIDFDSLFKSITVASVLEALGIGSLGIKSVWQWLWSLLSVSSYLFNTVVAFISSVYLLLEAKTMKVFFSKLLKAFVPEKTAVIIMKYLRNTNVYLKQYLYCTVIDGLIIGEASVIGLTVLGVKYAVVLGVVEGITNMIPYFGAIVGTLIVFVIVFFTDGLGSSLAVLTFLFVLQQIDGNIIKPKLFGGSFNISPFVVILSITIGGSYYGIIGMVVAIPVVAVLRNIINDLLDYTIAKKKASSDGLTFGVVKDEL